MGGCHAGFGWKAEVRPRLQDAAGSCLICAAGATRAPAADRLLGHSKTAPRVSGPCCGGTEDIGGVSAQHGVLLARQGYFADHTVSGAEVDVKVGGALYGTFTTDVQGRFCLGNLPVGTLFFEFLYQGETITITVEKSAGQDYQDLWFYEPMQDDKPNVYLYPPEATDVSVRLGFPHGGRVTVSDPPYGEDGWKVRAAPDGRIDAGGAPHGFLFYEARQPVPPCPRSAREGWLVSGQDFDVRMAEILVEIGLQGREIGDFVDWWRPQFATAELLAVSPLVDAEVDALVTLDITPPPDRVRRVLLRVRPVDAPVALSVPDVPPFDRAGFTVVEWGVLRELASDGTVAPVGAAPW